MSETDFESTWIRLPAPEIMQVGFMVIASFMISSTGFAEFLR